jgi:aconitate hydratase
MNSFNAKKILKVSGRDYEIYRLDAAAGSNLSRLPYSLRIVLENLLRNEDGGNVTASDIQALASWNPETFAQREIAFMPARVLMQDFTGVPAMVDLAAMRDAMANLGGDPTKINPLQPAELVIDHSVQVDAFGVDNAVEINSALEYKRNRERYTFLRWGQTAFKNFVAVPPETGIIHQVNCEHLARVVFVRENENGMASAYPDTLVGTDSHTTMVNGLGVLGWGVGGIEAEAALLGQPLSMLVPPVVGFRLEGKLPEGATATDLVLTIVQMLRAKGVVGKFVEYYGSGVSSLTIADRVVIANMAPEYGATCGIFPIDAQTLSYLRLTGRSEEQIALVEAYTKEQGLFQDASSPDPFFNETLSLDLGAVAPSLAGPKRPQDRVLLSDVKASFAKSLETLAASSKPALAAALSSVKPNTNGFRPVSSALSPAECDELLGHGSVVIASITSCTNTSNPSVMIAAGLLAKKAVEKGLSPKPWVKTSLAPGSQVVTAYLKSSGLAEYLDKLGFQTIGYGCATCIGNSGPLSEEVSAAIERNGLVVCSVLSGNRNFEGRINPDVKANYLASPPLVVAYALTGRIDIDLYKEPIGINASGEKVYLSDIWPSNAEIQAVSETAILPEMFREVYKNVFEGDERWKSLPAPTGQRFAWDTDSTYVKQAPYFDDMSKNAPERVSEIEDAKVLALLGDSITTDHISPAGAIKKNSPAGEYLTERGVAFADFNSYGSRRGNHEIMARGAFANIRLRNQLAPGTEGGFTTYLPTGEVTTIFDAATRYQESGTPLIILAGKEYGSGSSRDWAAKGPKLLGVKAVIAESFERIHRSNLVGMGILPLQFPAGTNAASLGLTGHETFTIEGLANGIDSHFANGRTLPVKAKKEDGSVTEFDAVVRIDTDQEVQYYKNDGILPYVLRNLLA